MRRQDRADRRRSRTQRVALLRSVDMPLCQPNSAALSVIASKERAHIFICTWHQSQRPFADPRNVDRIDERRRGDFLALCGALPALSEGRVALSVTSAASARVGAGLAVGVFFNGTEGDAAGSPALLCFHMTASCLTKSNFV